MELCQVITVTDEDYFDSPTSTLINRILFPGCVIPDADDPLVTPDTIKEVTPLDLLIPTGEDFRSMQACKNHCIDPANGNKYGGRRWRLVGARGEDHTFFVEVTKQFTFKLEK